MHEFVSLIEQPPIATRDLVKPYNTKQQWIVSTVIDKPSLIISKGYLNGEAQASCSVAHGKKIIPCIEDIEACRIHIKERLDQPILNS